MGRTWWDMMRLEWGGHPFTLGRLVYLWKRKYGAGLRVAYYRDVVRPRILATPPVPTPDGRCEIHVLTSDDDWLNLLWALKTFYRSSGSHFALCIHDDGTLRPAACEQLRRAFPLARLISRADADAHLEPLLADYPRCRALRTGNRFSLKVFDFHAYLGADRMLLLDSDVLFFARPAALLALIADPECCFNSLNQDWRYGYSFPAGDGLPPLDFPLPPLINYGLGLIHRGSAPLAWIEEFLALPGIFHNPYVVEQTLAALCSGRFGYRMLPAEYDVHMGTRHPGVPSRHYAGPSRPLMYSEGIRDLVRDGLLDGP